MSDSELEVVDDVKNEDEEDEDECIACYHPVTEEDKLVCGHKVHKKCIEEWGKDLCPMCKTPLGILPQAPIRNERILNILDLLEGDWIDPYESNGAHPFPFQTILSRQPITSYPVIHGMSSDTGVNPFDFMHVMISRMFLDGVADSMTREIIPREEMVDDEDSLD